MARYPGEAVWRKSTRSGGNSDCVEVADLGEVMAVRDSKDQSGPRLSITAPGWRALVGGIKNGMFDR